MKEWMLGHDGFIMEYMIAGPKVTPFKSDERAENQLELEARLRAQIVTPKKEEYQVDPRLGQEAENGVQMVCRAPEITALLTYPISTARFRASAC